MKRYLGVLLWCVATAAPAAELLVLDAKTTLPVLGPVTHQSMNELERAATAAVAAGADHLTLVLDSRGGVVDAGMHAVAVLQTLQADGVTLRCVVTGNARSMAFILLTVCDERFVLANSQLLWHPIRVCAMFSCQTGITAAELRRALLSYELPLQRWVRSEMDVPAKWFWYHWRHETVHRGETLAAKAPSFVSVVPGVTGVPVGQLFYIP